MPGISHRGWNCQVGWVPGLRGLPPAVGALPPFSLHPIPLSLPGLAQSQTEEREQLPGISRASRGRWELPFPSFFTPPLSFSSFPLRFPLLPFPPLHFPPFLEGQDGRRGGEGPGPFCVQDVQWFGTARRGLGARGRSRTAGQLLEEFRSPHTEPQNLASWSWKGLPGLAPPGGILLRRATAWHQTSASYLTFSELCVLIYIAGLIMPPLQGGHGE